MAGEESNSVLDRDFEDLKEIVKVNCKTESGFCGKCCYETEMPLTERDVERIERLGYKKEDFSVVVDGIIRLKNVNGKCFFLKDNKCTIYEHRPIGCRIYPAIFDGNRVIVDEYCPRWREVKVNRGVEKILMKLIDEIYG